MDSIPTIKLRVKHLTARVYEFDVESKITVEEFKAIIGKEAQADPKSIKLIFKGKILKDDKAQLKDLGIQDRHTIHMVKRSLEANIVPNQPGGSKS